MTDEKEQKQAENKENMDELEQAKRELLKAREKVKKVKEKYTIKGCKVKVNKVYASLYKREDLNEVQKIKEFWRLVDELKKQYVGN